MRTPRKNPTRVLAVDPYSRGVGFAVLEGPDCLIDWGLKSTKTADNRKAVRVIETLIKRFRPDILVLEDWDADDSRRCSRIQELLIRVAQNERNRLRVRVVSMKQIRKIGPLPQCATKYGRSIVIAERFPELRAFLPPFRKPWMHEDDRMSIFDAAGFALAQLRISSWKTQNDDAAGAPEPGSRS